MRHRRGIVVVLIAALLFVQLPLVAQGSTSEKQKASTDWSKAMVNSTIKRFPTADSLKGWGYAKSLYLYGQYLVYLRTGDKKYLDHIQAWIDLHVDDKGVINRPITALDYMLPGNLCLILYKEKQLLIYYKHLNDPETGLLHHAYDESGAQPWANPATHVSAYFWCRAIGWFGMTLIEILELLPKNHPKRPELIAIVRQLAKAYERYQDPKTGLWYQIVDKGGVEGNWLETSSSSMYSYMNEQLGAASIGAKPGAMSWSAD